MILRQIDKIHAVNLYFIETYLTWATRISESRSKVMKNYVA
jgi:hypothetical protein